jgi:cell wall-associated NlpC family hydrolase
MRTGAVLLLVALSGGACASGGAVPRPFPGAAVPPDGIGDMADRAEPRDEDAEAPGPIVQTALQFVGVPYRNGGSDPRGFDCSGFVPFIFARHGTALPREVRDQYLAGRQIELRDVLPGDLLFFETVSRGASHVGMVIGSGRFVHAPSSRGTVRVEPYTASYWARRFVGARRIDPGAAAGVSPAGTRAGEPRRGG